jgi:hypothetical protein
MDVEDVVVDCDEPGLVAIYPPTAMITMTTITIIIVADLLRALLNLFLFSTSVV